MMLRDFSATLRDGAY